MIQIIELLQGIAVAVNSSFIERAVSVGVGAGIALSVTSMCQPRTKEADRTNAIASSPPKTYEVKRLPFLLIVLGILALWGMHVQVQLLELQRQTEPIGELRQKIQPIDELRRQVLTIDELYRQVLPIGSIIPFAGNPELLKSLAARGWAVCDGRDSASQGINDAVISETPDLRKRFLQGADVAAFKQQQAARFPVLMFNNERRDGNTYHHGKFNVTSDGSSMLKEGLNMFAGKWEHPASVLDVKWETTNGMIDVAPPSYTVVYIMLMKYVRDEVLAHM
jgi:hypothetical protein